MVHGALLLENGSIYFGKLFGDTTQQVSGEVVFQTGMVGYCESLSDPSYNKQILVLTYPLIGNYGVPDENEQDHHGVKKNFESHKIWAQALVCSELSQHYSHWSAKSSLDQWMDRHKTIGIQGIDTRRLTKELTNGTILGKIINLGDRFNVNDIFNIKTLHQLEKSKAEEINSIAHQVQWVDPSLINLVDEVSIKEVTTYNADKFPRIMLVDCGAKNNIVRCLLQDKFNVQVQVVPWSYDIVANVNEYDGLMISNGPGDPIKCQQLIRRLNELMQDKKFCKPIFGICLGHQLMGLAAGFTTYKMNFGNRGHNQPCKLVDSNRCLITSQNHGYALSNHSTSDIPDNWTELFINANDKSNEGIAHISKPFFSTQFHPEHNAGPDDSEFLFDIFIESVLHSIEGLNGLPISQIIREHLSKNASIIPSNIKKVLILGSGGLSIGQAGEFDYSGSQAIKALRNEKIFTILVNPNIATVQTSPSLADRVYLLPVTYHYVKEVIKSEHPDGLMLMFGGQTALNCGIELAENGVLDKFNVKVLGPPIDSIKNSEDRKLFAEKVAQVGGQVAPSSAVSSVEDAKSAANKLGYPVLVRAAYALGGLGSGFAENNEELATLVSQALIYSPQVLLDKSLKGWKEVEYEVVRDVFDNCATICNMENVDPLGIHTGESIVVAPSQTLNDSDYNKLRSMAIKIVRHLGVIGECNIQYAVNPQTSDFYIIEVNPRLSRSSALASKATGYPLAYIAAKLALGKSLIDLENSVTGTSACFEPSLDYCVVKIPRWDLSKFAGVTHEIGSSMKSIGEVMSIGRNFEEAFQKALRMVDENVTGFDTDVKPVNEEELRSPTDKRIFVLAAALKDDYQIDELYKMTSMNTWFLTKMRNIVDFQMTLAKLKSPDLDLNTPEFRSVLLQAKRYGFSDKQIGNLIERTELIVRKARCDHHRLTPFVKRVDTVSAEWPARTNYLYLTYNGDEHDIEFGDFKASSSVHNSPIKRVAKPLNEIPSTASEQVSCDSQQVMVLGSGVYRIGSSVEFDCCAVGCVEEIRRLDKQVIMLNYNPETVSTDFDVCDKLYFDEISFEIVMDIYDLENPMGIVVSMGGQIPNNIAMQLHRQQAIILGTSPDNIDNAENRFKFSRLLDTYNIGQPVWRELQNLEAAKEFCKQVKYPCIVRPSYVLSGAAMNVAYSDNDLEKYLSQASAVSKEHPVVISKFLTDAKEIDIDAVAQHGELICMAVSEHIENAGVHSGDATLVTPPQDLNVETMAQIRQICGQIAIALEVNGPFNLQLIAKDNQLKVIECNLRASRSFPFVSKTLNYDFIAVATKVIMGEIVKPVDVTFGQLQPSSNYTEKASRTNRVGVKVPQFSFSRLSGADIKLGVEMASTGEVACFGDNRKAAYLKAMISTGFRIPERKIVLLSIGSYRQKEEFEASVITLAKMGYRIYATQGTADYYNIKLTELLKEKGIDFKLEFIDWPFGDVGVNLTTHDEIDAIAAYLSAKEFDLVINLPMRSAGARRVSTLGYRTRRFAVDHAVPLISDIKCAKLLIEALTLYDGPPDVSDLDCLTASKIITLPGLIDVHVHVREPGATHKEDFDTATSAAIAGGVTIIGAMPNTTPPITDLDTLRLEQQLAKAKARCDYGLILGATPTNAASVASIAQSEPVMALKMYLNNTFGTLCMSSMVDWQQHFLNWPNNIPICVHAEGKTAAAAILFAQFYNKHVHICHVAKEEEILLIKHAKSMNLPVTCEVAPHHLLLSDEDLATLNLGDKLGAVKPPLMPKKDQDALWDNLDIIDCFATDHAPHLLSEKMSDKVPPGFPGLETMLPLLLTCTQSTDAKRQLTLQQIIEKLYTNPKRIFNIPDQPNTYVEVDMSREWEINEENFMYSKSKWSPFVGMKATGKVSKVVIRGEVAFVDDKLIVQPGFGQDIMADRQQINSSIRNNMLTPTTFGLLNTLDTAFRGRSDSCVSTSNIQPQQSQQLQPPQQMQQTQQIQQLQLPQQIQQLQQLQIPQQIQQLQQLQIPQQPISLAPQTDSALNSAATISTSVPVRSFLKTPWTTKAILRVEMFDHDGLHNLFTLAEQYMKEVKNNRTIRPVMAGKIMASIFYEASTRTQCSFASAMLRLGGQVINVNESTSSAKKGESLEDTILVMSGYCDLIVLRHPEPGAVDRAASVCRNKPVINAGDGVGEHPTQALLDIFTIRKEIGTIKKKIISLVGDLRNSRTVHSLAKLLTNYDLTELRLVSPPGLEMPESICTYLREKGVKFTEFQTLESIIPDSDVIYMTRIQKERFNDLEEYKKCCGLLRLTPQIMTKAKYNMIVMHPLPRVDEISPDFDNDNRAAYFRQSEYGMYVRMALIDMVMRR